MESKITFTELTDLLAAELAELSATEAEEFLKALFDLISETLTDGEQVRIKDFGTFKLTRVKARESVDVNTGEKIEIPEHSRASFSPATALKELVNKPFSHFESVLLNEGVTFDEVLSFEPGEDEADDDIQEQITEKAATVIPATDKIAETIQMAAGQLETDSDFESVESVEVEDVEKKEDDYSTVATQIESLSEADDKVRAEEKEPAERRKTPPVLIPILGGIAIAAAAFFFSLTETKSRKK